MRANNLGTFFGKRGHHLEGGSVVRILVQRLAGYRCFNVVKSQCLHEPSPLVHCQKPVAVELRPALLAPSELPWLARVAKRWPQLVLLVRAKREGGRRERENVREKREKKNKKKKKEKKKKKKGGALAKCQVMSEGYFFSNF